MPANYRQIEQKLDALRPFIGNSCHATMSTDGLYIVTSYSTVIAEVDTAAAPMRRWISDNDYSKTTKRLQNLCRQNLPGRDVPAGERVR
jgi:hypothetical protein